MRIFYTTLLLLISSLVSAQTKTAKGKITGDDGSPLIGASVRIKKTSTGTTTDAAGRFTLTVKNLPATLVFEMVGYKSREYKLTEKELDNDIVIMLHASKEELAEVVVVGYGTERRRDMSYSFSTKTPPPGLSGKSDGIKIRGVSSLPDAPSSTSFKTKTSGINAGSKILTAGELSDFKKWKLWSGYTGEEFKAYSQQWEMRFEKRHCVQVQNEKYKPLPGQKVYLLNSETKDTVWQAITDNTGKAELWATNKDQDEQTTYLLSCQNKTITWPTAFEKGINRITLNTTCNLSSNVDIAFVVDATGSMGDEIQYLQAELQDIVGNIATAHKDVTLRLASVFYRDRGDEYLTKHVDFATDAKALSSFIKGQSAGGGGDGPEAVEDALTTAFDSLHWDSDARARLLFLVLDAPPHDEAKTKMKALMAKAAGKGVRIVPVVCSGIDKSTEYLMRCVALATNGNYIFLTDDSGVGNPHIKPTTDEFKVELLNLLLQRVIGEMIYTPLCEGPVKTTEPLTDTMKNSIKIVLYPNPTQGMVSIQSSEELKEIFITDFTGKILMRVQSGKKKRWEVNLSTYPSGTYLVKYFTEAKGWGAERLVLVH